MPPPCFTMREVPVVLEKAAMDGKSIELMVKALQAMGFIVTTTGNVVRFSGVHNTTKQFHSGTFADGALTFSGKLEVNAVKRAYAAEVIKKQFGQIGKVTKTADGKYTVNLKVT